MEQEEWKRLRKYYIDELNKLEISESPTEQELKSLVSRVDKIFGKAAFDYASVKVADDNIERLIDTVTISGRQGKNETERRTNGVISAMQYELDGQAVNLYELQKETNKRLVFMQQVMKVLDQKMRAVTITYGITKVESNVARY